MARAPAAVLALLAAACCRVGSSAGALPPAAVEDLAREVRGRAPNEFTVVTAPPFVVAGDAPPESVRADAADVVGWAVVHLKAAYFPNDPGVPIEIWMFASYESYMRNSSALFGTVPDTPYGFYAPCKHALLVNASSGYGTLIHEIVHPYIAANFPDAPTWFDEGLASLYEQSDEVGGRIHGRVNWRLPPLQAALRAGAAPALEDVMSTSRWSFYGARRAMNYAVARYLLYWLQERGLLSAFYRAFTANVAHDAGGIETLRAVAGRDAAARWRDFVLALSPT